MSLDIYFGNWWLDLVCLGGFIKLLVKKRRGTQGYGVKILKLNENNDQPIELSRG
jgi:hypothetical protein